MSELIELARAFAHGAHAGQTRKDPARSPYVTHLEEVAQITSRFGGSSPAICAAWLHDTVEDCPVSRDDIASFFGEDIAGIVMELTDDTSLPRAERKRLQVEHARGMSPEAALVKLADKCSNTRSMGQTPPTDWDGARRVAYVHWCAEVVAALPDLPEGARAHFAALRSEALERLA